MPKQVLPLSHTQIKSAKPNNKPYKLSDGKGLHLKVNPNGSKYWIFNYIKPITKKRTEISLGTFPEVSLETARKNRAHVRELIAQGIDPQKDKFNRQQALELNAENTLFQLFQRWIEIKKSTITQDYANDIERSFINYVFPSLGNMHISEITAPVAIKALQPLSNKGLHETVRRTCGRLNQIMEFAVNTGIIPINPLSKIKEAFVKPVVTNLKSIHPNELSQLLKELDALSMREQTRNLIMFQLHTMVRPNEAARVEWSDIDIKNCMWVIPKEKIKRKRDHTVLLSKQAIKILKSQESYRFISNFVFPSYSDLNHHMSTQAVNNIIKKTSFKGLLVSHGFRTLASTILNEQNFNPELVEVSLSHIDKNTVRAVYNRAEYIDPRREMMQWWSDHIEKERYA